MITKKINFEVKSDQPIRMIFVGRLVKEKNILNLLRALNLLPKNLQWTLDIYGDGYLKQEALDLANELNISGFINFNQFENDIYSKIAQSDLLIMPSISEGMPNVLVEALAIQIPVVAANIPAIMGVVGETGAVILVDPNDVKSIANGIMEYMVNQGVYIDNSSKGVELARNYDASFMSQKYHKEYKALSGQGAI